MNAKKLAAMLLIAAEDYAGPNLVSGVINAVAEAEAQTRDEQTGATFSAGEREWLRTLIDECVRLGGDDENGSADLNYAEAERVRRAE